MCRNVILVMAISAFVGCGKPLGNSYTPPPGAAGGNPTVGGAAQAVRGAVNRTVTMNELNNLRLFIDNASTGAGRMPSKDEIMAASKEDPKLRELLESGAIVLTGTKTRESVWAYEATALQSGGFVVTNTGIERMDMTTLKQRLQAGN